MTKTRHKKRKAESDGEAGAKNPMTFEPTILPNSILKWGQFGLVSRTPSSPRPLPSFAQTPRPSETLSKSPRWIEGLLKVLFELMASFPSPPMVNPEIEVSKFNWILLGTEEDLREIHEVCGISRKMLHLIGQVTYCSARLQQEPRSIVVPITAKYLNRGLFETQQRTVSMRKQKDDVRNDPKQTTTNLATEAWRIAAVIYLQCRLLRYVYKGNDTQKLGRLRN